MTKISLKVFSLIASLVILLPVIGLEFKVNVKADNSCKGYSSPGNPYSCNGGGDCTTGANCTWWVAYKRPDILPALQSYNGYYPSAGAQWTDAARSAGYTVQSNVDANVRGAIAVWNGHVAYVENVNVDNQTITISEMNCYGLASNALRNPVPFQVYPSTYMTNGAPFLGFILPKNVTLATNISITSLGTKIIQSGLKANNNIEIRVGNTSTNSNGTWSTLGGTAQGTPTLVTYNSKVYQFIKGLNNNIYYRIFDGANWTSFSDIGGTSKYNINTIVYNNVLYISIVGMDDKVYIRKLNSAGTFGAWKTYGGTAIGEIVMEVYSGKLYQFIRGMDNNIYYRSFDGTTWNSFSAMGGSTTKDMDAEVFNSKLYLVQTGNDSNIYTRNFNGTTWADWSSNGGATPGKVTMKRFSGRLYQASRGNNNGIYTRSMDTSGTWTPWSENGGSTNNDITMYSSGKLYQGSKGLDGKYYIRSFNGTTWSSWY